MTWNRPRGAWVWVTVVAITVASLARAQSGIQDARAYATPLIAFLAGNQLPEPAAAPTVHRATSSSHADDSGMVFNLLPVFFVGLVSPLNLLFAWSILCLRRALPAPDLAGRFQRPPPIFA